MPIGQLDQLLTFEAPTVCEDGYGGGEVDWTHQARAWASVKPVQAREDERQGAQRAAVVYMIECWQDGLTAVTEASRISWRIRPNDPEPAYLNIREIRRPPTRSMMMVIIAETGVSL